MKTQPASRTIELSPADAKPKLSEVIVSGNPVFSGTSRLSDIARKTARRDALSFSITFAVIAVLTGAMLLYKVAVTMSAITSFFFYASLGGMLFFAIRAIVLARHSVDLSTGLE